jgi:hypothetical protein
LIRLQGNERLKREGSREWSWEESLNTTGRKKPATLTGRARFSAGETGTASILTGSIAVPAGFWFAGINGVPAFAVIGAAVLPLFVLLPKLIQWARKADAAAVLDAFGKNEQVKKVFCTFFISMAGLFLARVVDPTIAQQIVGIITGMGV